MSIEFRQALKPIQDKAVILNKILGRSLNLEDHDCLHIAVSVGQVALCEADENGTVVIMEASTISKLNTQLDAVILGTKLYEKASKKIAGEL